jgi:ubiquinone/menaquinone biosynthesis C-methylase UbiE
LRIDLTGWIDRILAKPIRNVWETPRRLLMPYMEEGMSVLDVGCGAGFYSLGIARLVGPTGRVFSVDADAEAVAALKKKAEDAGFAERIETRICSSQDLGVSDLRGHVDFALAVYVVHHAANADTLMSDVYGALKRGRKFLVIEPKHHASAVECEAIEASARRAGFAVGSHPRLARDWAVVFVKD